MDTHDHIRLLCLDCDGVLTDGTLLISDAGEESKRFHVHDGLAIKAWQASGRVVAVITARTSPALQRRMEELGVTEVHQGASDKRAVFDDILNRHQIDASCVAYMGDDLGDIPVLSGCGLAMAPANACAEVRAIAQWVSERRGGEGAVRESVEMLMRHSGDWDPFVERSISRDSEND